MYTRKIREKPYHATSPHSEDGRVRRRPNSEEAARGAGVVGSQEAVIRRSQEEPPVGGRWRRWRGESLTVKLPATRQH